MLHNTLLEWPYKSLPNIGLDIPLQNLLQLFELSVYMESFTTKLVSEVFF